MRSSTPIHRLKRQARLLSRRENIPLHQALDRLATREGFGGWGLLVRKAGEGAQASRLYSTTRPGDLVLVGARPGQGKTLLCLAMAAEAMKAGNRAAFFSLEYSDREVLDRLRRIEADPARYEHLFRFDISEAISADYIIGALADAPRATLVVVDYLQILDQKRDKPELMIQIRALKAFARARGLVILFISQIDRAYDPVVKGCPDLSDIRLPNPLDLSLFDKAFFLHDGQVRIRTAG
jgi:replicative DNA helicase